MRIKIDSALISRNFEAFKDNPSLQESAQLFAQGRPITEMIQAFAMNRSVLTAFAGFDKIYPHGNLERGILEKVILCISVANACQFCVNSHLDITRGLGIGSADARDPNAPGHSPREKLALEYALAVRHDSNRVPGELYERLHQMFTDPELVELTFLVGFINMLNWFNNALDVRYNHDFEGIKVI
ncbi:MAG TPA: carboxymuconolactone decarboxylase family protein [Verrucomicrobiae bacterium]|jgi:AhpD family alkylhydroperoxidase|nr:carboxymuconolactone decarboxylase family protein [Verrucomicrobiae bacterium]